MHEVAMPVCKCWVACNSWHGVSNQRHVLMLTTGMGI